MRKIEISLKKKIIFISFITLIFVIFLEAGSFLILTFFENQSEREHPNYFELRPYTVFGLEKNYRYVSTKKCKLSRYKNGSKITINSLGFRGEEFSTKKEAGEYRIFIIGGSVVYYGSRDEYTISGYLQRELNNSKEGGKVNYRVINGGRPSYVSGQELSELVYEIVDYSPDMVIAFDGVNDFNTALSHDPRPGYPAYFKKLEERDKMTPLNYFLQKAIYRSNFSQLVYKIALNIWLRINPKTRAHFGKDYKPNWDYTSKYVENITKMSRICRAFDAKFVSILQPYVYFKDHRTEKEEGFLRPSYDQAMSQMYLRAIAELKQSAKKNNFNFYDFTNIFDSFEKEMYWDLVHFYDDGNAHVAAEIYKRLLHDKLLKVK